MHIPLPEPTASLLETPDTFRGAQRRFWMDLSPWILTLAVLATLAWRAALGPFGLADGIVALAVLALWPVTSGHQLRAGESA